MNTHCVNGSTKRGATRLWGNPSTQGMIRRLPFPHCAEMRLVEVKKKKTGKGFSLQLVLDRAHHPRPIWSIPFSGVRPEELQGNRWMLTIKSAPSEKNRQARDGNLVHETGAALFDQSPSVQVEVPPPGESMGFHENPFQIPPDRAHPRLPCWQGSVRRHKNWKIAVGPRIEVRNCIEGSPAHDETTHPIHEPVKIDRLLIRRQISFETPVHIQPTQVISRTSNIPVE